MESPLLKSRWLQAKGILKELWGEITGDELEFIDGQRDRLVGKLQQIYGLSEEEAQREVDRIIDRLGP